jgi:hypothetical protein
MWSEYLRSWSLYSSVRCVSLPEGVWSVNLSKTAISFERIRGFRMNSRRHWCAGGCLSIAHSGDMTPVWIRAAANPLSMSVVVISHRWHVHAHR